MTVEEYSDTSSEFDCGTCGACCGSNSGGYTPLTVEDRRRLPVVYQTRYVTYKKGVDNAVMLDKRTADGVVCVALEGKIGEKVGCSIYEHRPSYCKVFAAGSEACRSRRKEVGL